MFWQRPKRMKFGNFHPTAAVEYFGPWAQGAMIWSDDMKRINLALITANEVKLFGKWLLRWKVVRMMLLPSASVLAARLFSTGVRWKLILFSKNIFLNEDDSNIWIPKSTVLCNIETKNREERGQPSSLVCSIEIVSTLRWWDFLINSDQCTIFISLTLTLTLRRRSPSIDRFQRSAILLCDRNVERKITGDSVYDGEDREDVAMP